MDGNARFPLSGYCSESRQNYWTWRLWMVMANHLEQKLIKIKQLKEFSYFSKRFELNILKFFIIFLNYEIFLWGHYEHHWLFFKHQNNFIFVSLSANFSLTICIQKLKRHHLLSKKFATQKNSIKLWKKIVTKRYFLRIRTLEFEIFVSR